MLNTIFYTLLNSDKNYAWASGDFATVHFAIGLFAIGIFAIMQITRKAFSPN